MKAIPLNRSRDYVLEFAPLVPGKHRLRATITESTEVLYNFTATFGVGHPNTTTTMNPVSLVIR